MTFDPIKDATAAANSVADHIAQSLPGTVQAVAEQLGAEEITITIPEIKIKIAFGRRA
jgi:BarA-like signal transduction histidine kinase